MGDRPFEIVEPDQGETPLVVEVPHAGLFVPDEVARQLQVSGDSLARDADLFVHELYAEAPREGATLIYGTLSRYVVDLNRAEGDIDAESVEGGPPGMRAPRGVIWRLSGVGEKALARPLTRAEWARRIAEYHRPYHAELAQVLARKRDRFGIAVVLAAHSMPSFGRWATGAPGPARADVVPGTRGRSSADARFIDAIEGHASEASWSVRHDDPYRGGFTTGFYGRPAEGIHAVQVELARRLYMDEDKLTRHTKFQDVRDWCRRLVARLGGLALR
jgi:N-formylglutamate amidohydrolase